MFGLFCKSWGCARYYFWKFLMKQGMHFYITFICSIIGYFVYGLWCIISFFFMFISVRWKMWSFRNHHDSYLEYIVIRWFQKTWGFFHFLRHTKWLIFAWWIWGLVQFLDVKLDFVGQCVPGVEIQRLYSCCFYSIL